MNKCSICFEAFLLETNRPVLALSPCGHVFHEKCWKEWKKQQRRNECCSVCSQRVTQSTRLFLDFTIDDVDMEDMETEEDANEVKEQQNKQNQAVRYCKQQLYKLLTHGTLTPNRDLQKQQAAVAALTRQVQQLRDHLHVAELNNAMTIEAINEQHQREVERLNKEKEEQVGVLLAQVDQLRREGLADEAK